MSDWLPFATAVALTFVVAGLVKGVVGMGLPTVAIGVLGLSMTPGQAAAIVIVPSLVTNVWQLLAGGAFRALLRQLAGMLAASVIGTFLSIGVLAGHSAAPASAALGAILVVYGAYGLLARTFTVPVAMQRWTSPLVGLLTGLVAGTTGVFVFPGVPYLNSLGLDKDALIQALGIFFTVSTVALGAALALAGKYPLVSLGTSFGALLPALLGMALGQRLRRGLSPATFRRWFFIGLVALGLYMLARVLLKS